MKGKDLVARGQVLPAIDEPVLSEARELGSLAAQIQSRLGEHYLESHLRVATNLELMAKIEQLNSGLSPAAQQALAARQLDYVDQAAQASQLTAEVLTAPLREVVCGERPEPARPRRSGLPWPGRSRSAAAAGLGAPPNGAGPRRVLG